MIRRQLLIIFFVYLVTQFSGCLIVISINIFITLMPELRGRAADRVVFLIRPHE